VATTAQRIISKSKALIHSASRAQFYTHPAAAKRFAAQHTLQHTSRSPYQIIAARDPRPPRPYSPSRREGGCSRKPGFRCIEFSETQFVPLFILGNPIYRGNSMLSGLRLCTNARTTFRCTQFSETQSVRKARAVRPRLMKRSYSTNLSDAE
jgi:hypothetical protein